VELDPTWVAAELERLKSAPPAVASSDDLDKQIGSIRKSMAK